MDEAYLPNYSAKRLVLTKRGIERWETTSQVMLYFVIIECQHLMTVLLAMNIEHYIERTGAFVVIVLGEVVLSVVYHATGSQIGLKRYNSLTPHSSSAFTDLAAPSIYANAVCGLIIAFNICWLCKWLFLSISCTILKRY